MTTSISLGNMHGASREALRQSLIGMLGPEGETKQAAEDRIRALEIMEQYGVHLVEFVLDSNYELAVRELAATNLKSHIETHWNSSDHDFQPPETPLESKTMIKALLPVGLRDSNNKIRAAVVRSISRIAEWDWPENWPELLDVLVHCLGDETEFSIHGALWVLTELTAEELTKTQIQHGSSVILREMYRIYECKDQYSVKVRNKAVDIFIKMVSAISVYEQPELIKQYLEPVIPKFCKKFIETLKAENDFEYNRETKMNIVKAIHVLVAKVPKCISDYLPQVLPMIWEILMDIAKDYQENTVNGGNNINSLIDYDAITTFEFLAHLMTGPDGYELRIPDYNLSDYHWFYLLDNYIPPEAFHHLLNLLQITEKQIQLWNDNVNEFIYDEELKSSIMNIDNVRRGAEDLLITIIEHPERAAANSLIVLILKQLEAENKMRVSPHARNNENWWKSYETYLLVFGLAKEIIIKRQEAGTLHFDVRAFLENVVLADLNNPASHPLLVGRCLCLGGIYADQLQPKIASRFLETTVQILRKDELSLRKLCAIRASVFWYDREHAIGGNSEKEEIFQSHLPALYLGLHHLGCQLLSQEIIILVLRSVAKLVAFDKEFTHSIESKICPMTIEAFFKFRKNYSVRFATGDIFKELTLNPNCIGPFQRRFVPKLIHILTDADPNIKTRDAVFGMLEILVKHSPRPLSSLLIEKAFPACCEAILTVTNEDFCTLNSAAKVLKRYLFVAADQVVGYQNEDGKTGSQYIVEVVTYLLNFKRNSTHVDDACKIMISFLKTAGNKLEQNMDKLLTALLTTMRDTDSDSLSRQSLLFVFAHLINAQFNTVLKFLTTAPDAASQSALAFVMSDGFCKEYKFFPRDDDLKTVTLALSRILEYGVANRNSPLHKITVKYPQAVLLKTVDGKTFSVVSGGAAPLLVNISKIITNYLSTCKEVEAK